MWIFRPGGVLALALAIVASACSATNAEPSASPPDSGSVGAPSTPVSTDEVDPRAASGSAVWALIDSVPAFRKAGVQIVAGADYLPLLDADLGQAAAQLTLGSDRALFAIAPERGSVSFDHVQLGSVLGSAAVWPFVITDAGTLTVFAPANDERACVDVLAEADLFAPYGIAGDVEGRLAFQNSSCARLAVSDGVSAGYLAAPAQGVRAFGAMITASANDSDGVLSLDWLALADSSDSPAVDRSGAVRVEVVGREFALAARSVSPDDDVDLDVLHGLRSDGSELAFAVSPDGSFTMPVDELGPRVKLWIDDYGLEQFVAQGPWIDTERLTRSLVIDLTPTFELGDEPPLADTQSEAPHSLRVWNGAASMDRQEYSGLGWNNNLGLADRDRSRENPNNCVRTAWLGGSYTAAHQTRVDQKPGLIAEALLEAGSDQCYEVITFAKSLYSVETHVDNARRLVEEFGVTRLVFAISWTEICRMSDIVYSEKHGVAADTPVHWRLIDGELVAPFTRREATEVANDPDYDRNTACSFTTDDEAAAANAASSMAKLTRLSEIMEGYGPDVEVTFMVMKDVLGPNYDLALSVFDACVAAGVNCELLDRPESREKPEDLAATDYNPFLLRYLDDGHPNARANQAIARTLACLLGEEENVACRE